MLRPGPWCNGGLCHPGAEHCPGRSRVPRPRNLPLPVAARPQDCTKAKTRQNDEGRTFRSGARTPDRFSPSQGHMTRGLSDAGLPGCRARLGILRSTQISASKSEPIVTNWREVFSHGRAFLAKLEMFNLIVMLPEKVAVGPWSPPRGLLALLAGGRWWGGAGSPSAGSAASTSLWPRVTGPAADRAPQKTNGRTMCARTRTPDAPGARPQPKAMTATVPSKRFVRDTRMWRSAAEDTGETT